MHNPSSLFGSAPGIRKPASQRRLDPVRSRARMVREQIEERGITDPLVLAAMNAVPRHLFVADGMAGAAYEDASLPIGYGQTISQPWMVARIMSLLELKPGLRILEIGSGSGYQAALLAACGCTVYGIERIRELYRLAAARIRSMGIRTVHLYAGDGTLGFANAAPFDRIIVSAGGPVVPPPLLAQLDDPGHMIMPVGPQPRAQRLLRISKRQGRTETQDMGPAVFVDLIGKHGW